jgi:NitT/TauT family transport system substrate-binding protein
MSAPQVEGWTRRCFLGGLTLAGTAGLLGLSPRPVAAEPPPETTKLRLGSAVAECQAPQYVAEELLRAEGFTEVQYVSVTELQTQLGAKNVVQAYGKGLISGALDLSVYFGASGIVQIDEGYPVVLLGGVHTGCYELFASDRVHVIRELRGKTVAITGYGSTDHLFLASMAAYVGLDPQKDITWVEHSYADSIRLLDEGQIDAVIAYPPLEPGLRVKKTGHTLVQGAVDRPWSQYFCCNVVGSRAFVRKHPVATKRALRAILKAADVCATEPERATQVLVGRGLTIDYGNAVAALKAVAYDRWRELDSEDSVRFWSLRLHEAGLIKSTPQKIIAQGTDWRFLTELKKEMKG